MDNKHREEHIAYATIFGLLIAFSVFVLKQYFYASEKPLDLITAAIYFWTGVILIIYTYETYQLRSEAQRQTELQLRPFLVVEGEYGGYNQYRATLRNLGNGTAVNIQIKDVKEESTQSVYEFSELPIMLTAGERRAIACDHVTPIVFRPHIIGDHIIGDRPLSLENLYPPHAKQTTVLTIEFKNIEGQSYVVKQTISRDNVSFDFSRG